MNPELKLLERELSELYKANKLNEVFFSKGFLIFFQVESILVCSRAEGKFEAERCKGNSDPSSLIVPLLLVSVA